MDSSPLHPSLQRGDRGGPRPGDVCAGMMTVARTVGVCGCSDVAVGVMTDVTDNGVDVTAKTLRNGVERI